MQRHFFFRDWELKERLLKRSEIQTICDDLARAIREHGQQFMLDTSCGLVPKIVSERLFGFLTSDKCAKLNYAKIIKGAKKRGLTVRYEWSPTTEEEHPVVAPFYVFS